MSNISLRLPPALEADLAREAERANKPRSEVAREAITEYLTRRERDRLMQEIVEEARRLTAEPEARLEALEVTEEAVSLDNEALGLAENAAQRSTRAAKRARAVKWWR